MNVLHVTEILPGGIATYFNEILPWQGREFGVERVGLICPSSHLEFLSDEAKGSVTLMPYQRSGRNLGSLLKLWKFYRRALHVFQPSIIHVHGSFAGAICRLQNHRRRPPVVYCPHGWSFEREDPKWAKWVYASLERLFQYRTDAIVAISEYEKTAALRARIKPDRIFVIRIGLDPSRLRKDERVRRSNKALELLFIGRMDRQKGIDELLELMRKLPPDRVRLTVIGAPVVGIANKTPDLSNVRYIGWVSAAQIDSFIDACDAVIMPSRWEGLGLVALEAMRRAVPVLVSNKGALPEVIGTDEAGITFDVDDMGQLANTLLALKRNTLTELGQRGQKRFLAYFTSERMNRETRDLYETLLSDMQPIVKLNDRPSAHK